MGIQFSLSVVIKISKSVFHIGGLGGECGSSDALEQTGLAIQGLLPHN